MSVATMMRVTIFAHRARLDDVVARLQRAGVIEVTAEPVTHGEDAEELPAVTSAPGDERLRRLDEYAADVHFLRTFLSKYRSSEQPFSSFVSEKFHMDEAEFLRLKPDTGLLGLYRRCEAISDKLASLDRERARLRGLIADLAPWVGFHLQIAEWRGTEHVVLITGTVPAHDGARIRQGLREIADEVTVEELGPVGSRSAWAVLVHRESLEAVRAALSSSDFAEVGFAGLSDYPAEESARAEARLLAIEDDCEAQAKRAGELAAQNFDHVVALDDAIATAREALTIRERFAETERTFVVSGWVPESARPRLERALAPLAEEVEIDLREPTDEERPPVELENPWFLRPFETLTDLYGRPSYGGLDPTPLLAPFFFLFFGICIGDVGYGVALMVGAWLIKTRLDVAPGVKRFMDLLMMGGVAAILVGVPTGSYFAAPADLLPGFLRALIVLDPLNQLLIFLAITLALGVTQVVFGVLIAAYDAARHGDWNSAVLDQLSTLLLFAAVPVGFLLPTGRVAVVVITLAGMILAKGHVFEAPWRVEGAATWDRAAGVAWTALLTAWVLALAFPVPVSLGWPLLAATLVGMFVSRAVRAAFLGTLGGLYEVYGMSGLIGDILSYTRLAALGLSGMLVGMVFNILTGMLWSIRGGVVATIVGIVAGVALLLVGHTFNVVINLLGAFVHPARLQFVEFFSKFYEGGGKPFSPFRYRTKSLVLNPGAGQEGGA
ncbi:MAG: V-type ATP synthase subunit I [Coriobacteriia bacterium]